MVILYQHGRTRDILVAIHFSGMRWVSKTCAGFRKTHATEFFSKTYFKIYEAMNKKQEFIIPFMCCIYHAYALFIVA